MSNERLNSRTWPVALALTLASCFLACGGDDTISVPTNAGAAGMGGTQDASTGAGGAGGTSAHPTGIDASDGAAVVLADAQLDGVSEEAAPFSSQILFDFVPADAGGTTLGWVPVPGTAGSRLAVVSDDQAPLSPSAGALELRGVFPPPDQTGFSSMSLEVTFGDPNIGRDFTGASNFHFWVRVVTPGGVLQSFQPFVQGGALSSYSGTYQPFVASFDDAWHEYVVPVAGQFYLSSVWKLGIQLFAATAPPSGGADGGDDAADASPFDDSRAPGDASSLGDATSDTGGRPDASAETDADAGAGGAAEAEASAVAEGGIQDANAGQTFIVHLDYVWVN